jgi:predicted metalloprotease with PDZ domain
MTAISKQSLWPCELLEPIGAGGMGEVFRARDTRLNRQVAVRVLVTALFFTTACLPTFGADFKPIVYTLSYAFPRATKVHVRLDLAASATTFRTFAIPRAIPMGYGEEPYDRFVSDVRAYDAAGKSVAVLRTAGPRWQIGSAVRVEYDVDLARMEQEIFAATDSSRVRQGYAFMLGYSIFGFIEGLEDLPVELRIKGPEGWPVFSTLAPAGGAIRAKDFYALADSQAAMGPGLHLIKVHYPREQNTPLTLAIFSETNVDHARLERLSGEAMTAVIDYFAGDGSAPFQHYTVLLEFVEPFSTNHNYGFGMEHLESFHAALKTSDANPSDFPDLWFRYFIAHHVAHAWIPKRCYGTGYYPFSWGVAPKIDTIWFSEGFAQYAAMSAVAKDKGERQQMLDHRFRSVIREAAPELRRLPLRELSLRASTNYVCDFRVAQLTFSRGALMAEEMDTQIRTETHGQKSLRDALRALVSWSEQNHRAFLIEELPARFYEGTRVDTKATLEKWMAPP